MTKPTTTLRSRTGQNVPEHELRTRCVSVRLTDVELASLDAKRGKMRRGEWMRVAALDKLPDTIPEANLDLAYSLTKSLGALGALMIDSKFDNAKQNQLLDLRAEVIKLCKVLKGQ